MMINEMKNSRSSDLLPMFYDCKYFFQKKQRETQGDVAAMAEYAIGIRDTSSY